MSLPFFCRIVSMESVPMSNRLAAVAVILAAALTMSACANTVRGVGRDVGNTVDATGAAANDIAR